MDDHYTAIEALTFLLPYIDWQTLPVEVQEAVQSAFLNPQNHVTRRRTPRPRAETPMTLKSTAKSEPPSETGATTWQGLALILARRPDGVTATDMVQAGMRDGSARSTLCILYRDGKLRRVAPGVYKPPE